MQMGCTGFRYWLAIAMTAAWVSTSAQNATALRVRTELLLRQIEQQMVAIPAGSFEMGDLSGKGGNSDEKPVHVVKLKGFRLSRFEVTFEQYDVYADAAGRPRPSDEGWGRGSHPVINVSWYDAQGFIAWLNTATGHRYRLPSEAEWEYAARAGSRTDYPWGNDFDRIWTNGASPDENDTLGTTMPVGSFPANSWGLRDMIGNVWEWTQDCSRHYYDGAPVDGSARVEGDCVGRMVRGGAWALSPYCLRVSYRFGAVASRPEVNTGFRLARDN
jgi:formylglycine-generating enzyme required for sulfatase activity